MVANLTTRLGQLTSSPAGGPYTGANKIINGDMAIAQRSTSTAGVTGGSYTTCDRWNMFQNIATLTVSQDTDVPTAIGVGFSQKYTVTTTGTASTTGKVLPCQSIEGFNFADASFGNANAKSVIVSFWAKASITGTYGVWMRNSAGNRYICNVVSLTAATWTFCSVTFAGDTSGTWIGATNGIGITVGLTLDQGSNNVGTVNTWGASENTSTSAQTHWAATNGATFFVTAFKVELGSIATPFVPDDYQVSFVKCQRYTRAITGNGSVQVNNIAGFSVNASNAITRLTLQPPMRAAPSLSVSGTYGIYGPGGAFAGTSIAASGDMSTEVFAPNIGTAGGQTANAVAMMYLDSGSKLLIVAEL